MIKAFFFDHAISAHQVASFHTILSSIFAMILSNQLPQQISAKMSTVFTADGLEELEESMAQCNNFKSVKCSCTDYFLSTCTSNARTQGGYYQPRHKFHSIFI